MLKLLFCKVADVFDRQRHFLFTAKATINSSGQATLEFPLSVELEDMDIEGYVTFYDDVEGLVTYWCSFYNLQKGKNDIVTMSLSVSDLVDQVQRRQDLKSSVRFKIEIDYMDYRGRMRFCQGEVENISAAGVFFTSEHRFALGDSVVLRLSEISPRLFTGTHILRIQTLDQWESSPWLVHSEEKPLAPPKPPAPEGQNIFSFVRKRKQAEEAAQAKAAATVEPSEPKEKPRMAFEAEEDDYVESSERSVEEDIGGNTERYGYGCRFKKIGQANEIHIRKFVFAQERLRLQSTRGE